MVEGGLVETRCPFCGSADGPILYRARLYPDSFTEHSFSARRTRRREHYRIVRCATCSLVRSNPILDENRMNALYQASKFIFPEEERYAAETYASLFARLTGGQAGAVESLLEIGCSTGFFLERALDLGVKEVVGFEPSRDCVARARQPVRDRIIRDVYRPELLAGRTFDAVCSFHVFDHLRDPKAVLASAVEHLNPGGCAVLVCHDVEGWTARLLGDFSPIFDVEHVCLFSRKTMAMLLESAGLEAIEVGPLSNRYPLGYWLRLLPAAGALAGWLPKFLARIPIALKAGNLYGFGRRPA